MRPVALPPLESFGGMITGAVAIKVHHVKYIPFSLIFWHRILIMRTEYIQIVIDADINMIIPSLESKNKIKTKPTEVIFLKNILHLNQMKQFFLQR